MTTTKIYLEDASGTEHELLIIGEYVPAERGDRDRFGVPLEPDYPAYFELYETSIKGIDMDFDDLAVFFGKDAEYIENIVTEALFNQHEDDYEAYQLNKIL